MGISFETDSVKAAYRNNSRSLGIFERLLNYSQHDDDLLMAHHPELIADAFPEMLFDERCQKVRQALSSLKPLQKQRVIKYFFDNKTTYEIAEEEGCSHQAVCKSINGALKKLKKVL